jgi:hypothetical protein
MFGLSLSKVLLLVLVLAGAWIAYRLIARRRHTRDAAAGRSSGETQRLAAEDMVACPRCGVFTSAKSPKACAKPGCPYARRNR